jgi:hypothetical protein
MRPTKEEQGKRRLRALEAVDSQPEEVFTVTTSYPLARIETTEETLDSAQNAATKVRTRRPTVDPPKPDQAGLLVVAAFAESRRDKCAANIAELLRDGYHGTAATQEGARMAYEACRVEALERHSVAEYHLELERRRVEREAKQAAAKAGYSKRAKQERVQVELPAPPADGDTAAYVFSQPSYEFKDIKLENPEDAAYIRPGGYYTLVEDPATAVECTARVVRPKRPSLAARLLAWWHA